jgi:oleate hydratase
MHLIASDGTPKQISIANTDFVFTTLGSMTAASSVGSTDSAPPEIPQHIAEQDPTWKLWKEISKKQSDFGRPEVFYEDINASKFESFSLTFYDDTTFFDRMISWSGNQPGTGALVTFKHSKWGMSVVVPHQPHFRNQEPNAQVSWAYGLFTDEVGNFIQKPMKECTGKELLTELIYMLGFEEDMDRILASAVVIPSMLPYTMSQFVKRKTGDRPQVIPKNAKNFAFLGQFVEVPDDVVFTVEYSVRCAQIAVFGLCGVKEREVTPIYKGWFDPKIMYAATKTMLGVGV